MTCECETSTTLTCRHETRRAAVRAAKVNGLDYLEVSEDQRELTIYFLGHAPTGLGVENFRVTGGPRSQKVVVTDLRVCPQTDPERDNCVVVTLDRPGDFSTYRVCVADPPKTLSFDPRYRCLSFNFKAACPSDLDCADVPECPPPERPPAPEIDYLAKDYASFRRLILDRLAVTMPEWSENHVPDIGITMVELLAYVGDYLSYTQDAVATEAYLDTARQRISVRRHARLVDYQLHEGCNARAWVSIATSQDHRLDAADLAFVTNFRDAPDTSHGVPDWSDFASVPSGVFEVFAPMDTAATLDLYEAHNEIDIYNWGDRDCCLPRGATTVTLIDGTPPAPVPDPDAAPDTAGDGDGQDGAASPQGGRALHLAPGDVLIFEEVIGPRTGNPSDADPAHRHPVRLTAVEETEDPLTGQPLLEITWHVADALPFAVCVSTLGPPPACKMLEGVTVLRGNVVLADHGRWQAEDDIGTVPLADADPVCEGEGRIADITLRAGPFVPDPIAGPITFSTAVAADAPASQALLQDPRTAAAAIKVRSQPGPNDGDAASERHWRVVRDLLGSLRDDADVVAEIDDRRRAHLRFGDGELGRAPDPAAQILARARIGNGPDGNVGADKLTIAVHRTPISGLTLRPRNPLPATGGTAPEPVAEARLFAPYAYSREIARAVTPADYAEIAGRDPMVQRAAAEMRWNGSWYEVRVAIDALGQAIADDALCARIQADLCRYRRMGHDLSVRPAVRVPLDIALVVCVSPEHLRAHILAALRRRFSNACQRDGTLGYFHPDRLTFGSEIKLSDLMATAQAITGVISVQITRLHRLFEGPNGELVAGVLRLGPMDIALADSDPAAPENGHITFEMRGGR